MAQKNEAHPLLYIDLYQNIVDFIDPSDRATLTSLCLVCHNFYLESAPRLYHTIRFPPSNISYMKHIRFLETAAASTRCAKLVRNYSARFSSSNPRIREVLPSLENLVSLSYSQDMLSFRHPIEPLLDKLTFPNLQFFRWNCITRAEALCQFYQRHPGLRGISVIWMPAAVGPEVLLGTLPKLEYLEGATSLITDFILGRPVERLLWLSFYPSPASLPPEIFDALRNLRHLVLRGPYWTSILSQIIQDLHQLEVLQLGGLQRWNMDSLMDTIKMLPCIKSMIFDDYFGIRSWKGDSHRFAVDLFQHGHPTLKTVYIKEELGDRLYQRFTSKLNIGEEDAEVLAVESVQVLIPENWIEEGIVESPSS
ncbi:hypothetical protein BDN72DRAFT_958608 [Pluteus cervinus]|uniref:Uncharacterized protein n=1 Tax=Pluteus cervinus TaxID=181527 RepID=A0ACD3AYT5_9AGAR|nr:hypothetical protein BDN72DRAFT_958608 [Pluteus cervinus]